MFGSIKIFWIFRDEYRLNQTIDYTRYYCDHDFLKHVKKIKNGNMYHDDVLLEASQSIKPTYLIITLWNMWVHFDY